TISNRQAAMFARLQVNGHEIKFQLDSGASINIMPKKFATNMKIETTQGVLKMWNGARTKPLGKTTAIVNNPQDNRSQRVTFMVVDEDLPPILGLEAIQQFGFVTFNHERFIHSCNLTDKLIDSYPNVFNGGLGKFEGEAHLMLNDRIPVALPARRVPFALREKLQAELARLCELNVLKKVEEPTDWVSQIAVVTKKNGELRICIDPKPLNEALRRERYALPTFDDILPDLAKAKYFTKVDLSSAFWHVPLDSQSSYVTTFATPYGRYRWTRLPFGLCVSSEIFQKRLLQAIEGLPGTTCVADDVLIYGATEEEHDRHLHQFLQRCAMKHIKLKPEKLELRRTEVTFHGHLLTTEGIKADPAKIKAVQEMPEPKDEKAVSRLNGMVNYLSRFLPRLAEVMKPIRQLTHKGAEWNWAAEQQQAFQQIKKLISAAPTLAYFDPTVPLVIQCDSSQYGLGAVLLQNERPVDYRSRALTETEQRYAQIEKEMLAVVFALERFNDYTFGNTTTVFSDHKPLVSISTKPLHRVPRRLQRMLIRLQRYDYSIVYKPGSQMYLADTLSRAFLPEIDEAEQEYEAVNASEYLAVTDEHLEQLKREVSEDPTIQLLQSTIQQGWPASKRQLPKELTPFFNIRDELANGDGLVFRGERLVIP
ncbi:MAG: RNase H-like domain-containing protein, partial [Candidatus Thiodiazotropha sp.]